MKSPILFAWLLALLVGCGGGAKEAHVSREGGKQAVALDAGGGQAGADNKPQSPQPRKVIYDATVKLIVEDFGAAEKGLKELVKSRPDALLADFDTTGYPGTPRSGHWRIRIPPDQLEPFIEAVTALGELQNKKLTSQDVTDTYYDLEGRIKNREAQLTAWRDMKDKATKFDDMAVFKRELDKSQEELESLQGQYKRLANLTTLATVTIFLYERKAYIPPESPEFSTTMGRTFWCSWDGLVSFGQAVILVLVALVPWLPVLVLVIAPFWWLARRRLRRTIYSPRGQE